MCGISGWVGPRDREAAERMRSTIRHRGPDDQGAYEDDSATLLHERLSIIDLAGGRQPMSDESGRYQIIFNGEIYNYRQLRGELIAQGHQFRTQSDTEVIVHLYEEMGERCPEKLIGMFAFAIWDSVERTLFLARDRLGIKPLFYAELPGSRLLFASELKAILAHGGIARELDPEGLDQYLTFMYVPAPRTIVRGVRKLPPGHTLTVRDGHCAIRRYWELPRAAPIPKGRPFPVEASELRPWLEEAVRCRLISDVPLGAYLSGGLDSSLVVALMSLASDTPVNTFSVGFEEHGFDERRYSRRVADEFGNEPPRTGRAPGRHRQLAENHPRARRAGGRFGGDPDVLHGGVDQAVRDGGADRRGRGRAVRGLLALQDPRLGRPAGRREPGFGGAVSCSRRSPAGPPRPAARSMPPAWRTGLRHTWR